MIIAVDTEVKPILAHVGVECSLCEQHHFITVKVSDYFQWKRGGGGNLIQRVMPYLTDNERELLISGICGDCFDALHPDPYDDEAF